MEEKLKDFDKVAIQIAMEQMIATSQALSGREMSSLLTGLTNGVAWALDIDHNSEGFKILNGKLEDLKSSDFMKDCYPNMSTTVIKK